MLPDRITSSREDIKRRATPVLYKYIAPNHLDNFLLVARPYIISLMMEIVVEMTNEELIGWWDKGLKKDSGCNYTHVPLSNFASEIGKEIFSENKLTLA